MMTIFRLAIVALFLGILSGCGHIVDKGLEAKYLHDAVPPFASFNDLTYDPLVSPSTTPFLLNHTSPIMELGALGKTYVKGFELPSAGGDLRIIVRSYYQMGAGALYPMVTVLDEHKVPLGTSQPRAIRTLASTLFDGPTDNARLELPLLLAGDMRARARYPIVHTSRQLIEFGSNSASGEYQIAAATYIPIIIPGPSAAPLRLEPFPAGDLRISIGPSRS